jgi:hypothetical protein
LGSFLAAPRVLQAAARDNMLPVLKPFGKGSLKGDEPRRAILLVLFVTVVILLWAGDGTGGQALNAIAAVITMFFLYTYGMINLAAFIEAFGKNPSFRPRFRYFHWLTALLGGTGCVVAAFLISPIAAIVASVIIAAFLVYMKTRGMITTYGDARRGFVYSSVRRNLLRLATMKEDAKNWRPTVLVFSGNPATRENLVSFSVWLESGRGIVMLANILIGSPIAYEQQRKTAVKQLEDFCIEKNILAFPLVVVSRDLASGAITLLQSAGVGPIRPNVAVFGWKSDGHRLDSFIRFLRLSEELQKSVVLVKEGKPVSKKRHMLIDVWWRGKQNGNLMLLFAHLLSRNWEWSGSKIRVFRLVNSEAGKEPAEHALKELIELSRVDATPEAIVSKKPFRDVLHEVSSDADCVFLGFNNPAPDKEDAWAAFYEELFVGMPAVLLVNSNAGEDVLA